MATGLSFFRAVPRNSTQIAFREKIPTSSKPRGDSVHDLLCDDISIGAGVMDPNTVHVHPFGTGQPGRTFLMRLWSWNEVTDESRFIPLPLIEAKVTLGNIDGTAIARGTLMAEHIQIKNYGISPDSVEVIIAGPGTPAHLKVSCVGTRWLDFDFAHNGSPPADSANAFWKALVQ